MEESQAIRRVADALRHLKAFRASWNAGDLIDQESELSADDLSILIGVIDQITAMAEQGLHTKQ